MQNVISNDLIVVATPSQIDAFADKIAMQVIRFYELKTDGSPKPSKYLDTKEASNFLSKTSNAVRVMVCKNQIKSIKKGKSLYFLESDLIEYLESGRRKTPAELAENCEDVLINKNKGTKA